jgi:hypothetical protein
MVVGLLPVVAWAQASKPAAEGALQADSSGWVVLFRGDDAGLWNTAAGTRLMQNGYAVTLDRAPAEVAYVRVKRMDTGEAVIAACTPEQFKKGGPTGEDVLIQPAKQTWKEGETAHNLLGIAAYGMLSVKGESYVWKTSNASEETGYGGWGFGKVAGGGEACCWNGQPIGKTVFEIAVKAGDLSAADKKELLSPGSLVITKATWGKPASAVDITEAVKGLTKQGKLRVVANTENLGEGDGKKGRTFRVEGTINGQAVVREVAEGRNMQIIAPPVKAGTAVADALLNPGARGKAVSSPPKVDATGWMVLFRNDEPNVWNTDKGNPDLAKGFAGTLDKSPKTVLYLRMKRMDTGEAVIVPLNRACLTDNATIGINDVMLWAGGNKTWTKSGEAEKFLGICDQAFFAEKEGELYLAQTKDGKDTGFGGWGFGKAVGSDDVKCVWAGSEIPRTVFEIAVKDKPLTAGERADLLIPGKLEIVSAKWGHGNKTADVAKKLRAKIHQGMLEVALNTEFAGDPAPKEKKQLALTYRLNDVPFTKTFEDGAKLFLAAAPTKAKSAGTRGNLPTHDEIYVFLDAGLYAETLAAVDKTLALTGDASAGTDRHELLMLKAEGLIQTKDRSRALATLEQAAKAMDEKYYPDDAIALAAILKRSTNGQYVSPTGHPGAGVPMMNFRDRKAVYEALWKDEQGAMTKYVAAAKASGLPAIVDAGKSLVVARAAEFMATGKSDEAQGARKALAERAGQMVKDELQKDATDTEKLFHDANTEIVDADTGRHIGRVGLNADQHRRLNEIQGTCNQIIPALLSLIEVYDDVVDYRELGKAAEKIRNRAKEVADWRYQ